MSKAGIGSGKCIEFQNQSRFSSASLRRSSNTAQYGYISSQPSHPAGVSIEKGLGNAPTSDVAVAMRLSSDGVVEEQVKSIGLLFPTSSRAIAGVRPIARVDRDRTAHRARDAGDDRVALLLLLLAEE